MAEKKFPNVRVGGSKRKDPRFDQFALSKEERLASQALRPGIKMREVPLKRLLDSVDGDVVRVFCMAQSNDTRAGRERRVRAEIMRKLGTENYRILVDDGFQVVAQRVA